MTMPRLAPDSSAANALESYEKFDPLYDRWLAERDRAWALHTQGTISASEALALRQDAKRPLLAALASAGLTLAVYEWDRQQRETQERIRAARERAQAAVADHSRATIRRFADAVQVVAEVYRRPDYNGPHTLAGLYAWLDARQRELEERAGRGGNRDAG